MPYSNRSRIHASFDSLPQEEAVTAAVRAINDLNENRTPRGTELSRNIVRDVDEHLQEERTSTSDENQLLIGKMLVFLSKEIGKGNFGTVIYEGRYEHRPVAVKRLPRSHHIVVDREIEHLIKADQYRNIVRYHAMESDRNFYYLAMERCDCNLDDLIQMYSALYEEDRLQKLQRNLGNVKLWEGVQARPSPLLLKLMGDMVSGLVVLHALNIIHRDLKPKSILIMKEISTLCAKLSDMGISRSLSGNKSYLTNHNTGCAATGWKPREQLLCGHQTGAMDMFSLGCILFFCITRGKHPFGEPDERDRNIKSNYWNLLLIQDFPEACHLISRLLQADPEKRPKIAEVSQHPMFWGAEKRLNFLRDASNEANNNREFWKAMQNTRKEVFRGQWNSKVDKMITDHGKQFIKRNFNFKTLPDLLRLIRNMFSHHGQLPSDIQTLVGSQDEEFDDYFTSRFPKLLIEVYKVICQDYKERVCFKKYFKGNV